MTAASSTSLLASASHWEKIAIDAEATARWDRDHGRDLSTPGRSVGDVQAEIYLRCARTLRAEHETGLPHCMCHETPTKVCPNRKTGLR